MSTDTLAWLLSVPLIAVLHELGHALAARPAGYRVTSFGIGHGRPLLRWRTRWGVIVYLGRWLISGGLCVAIPVDPVPQRRWLYHSGGLMAQGVLALTLWPLSIAHPMLLGAAWFNLLVLAWNLLPLRIGSYATDGWHLIAPLLHTSGGSQFYAQRGQVARVLRLEQDNGSALGQAWCHLMLQWMDVVTGQDADGWEPQELVLMSIPQLEGLHAYVRAEQERELGASLAAIHRVQAHRREMAEALPALSRDMLALAEARAWIDQESPKMARQVLSTLVGASGPVARDAAAVHLQVALLEEDCAAVQAASQRLSQVLDEAFLDLPIACVVLFEGALWLKERGHLQEAEFLASRARRGANRSLAAARPEDRLPLARRLGAVAGVELAPERGKSLKSLLR